MTESKYQLLDEVGNVVRASLSFREATDLVAPKAKYARARVEPMPMPSPLPAPEPAPQEPATAERGIDRNVMHVRAPGGFRVIVFGPSGDSAGYVDVPANVPTTLEAKT